MTTSTSLANVVVFFSVIESPDDIQQLSDNARFRVTPPESSGLDPRWKGGQTGEIHNPFCFKFGENIHSPRGWVAGSAPTDNCDLRLAKTNKSGISRFHFRIDISPKNCPRITNLSKNEMRLHKLTQLGEREAQITLFKDEDTDIIDMQHMEIDLGEIRLRIWRPRLTIEEEKAFKACVDAFHEDYMQALPKPARVSAVPTLDIRFGLGQSAYRKISDERPRNGTFGSVIKVMELKSRQIYAAKIPHASGRNSATEDRKQWEMMSREYRKLIALQHENVVETVEILPGNIGNEPPWLIMEWVDQSLHSYAPSASEKPLFLSQVSSGLAYMHSAGFTHRDLKPENVLVLTGGPTAIAKIADFGLSKYAGKYIGYRNMHTYAGTLLYMAPELWDGERGYTNAVDIWSLGILALELLTDWDIKSDGPRNQGGPPSESLYREWVDQVVLPRQERAPRYKPLLESTLSKNPETRWDASTCERWLLNHIRHFQDDNSFDSYDGARFIRSSHPTLSTTRAESLPDTASCGNTDQL